jgi:hypothetical protein
MVGALDIIVGLSSFMSPTFRDIAARGQTHHTLRVIL